MEVLLIIKNKKLFLLKQKKKREIIRIRKNYDDNISFDVSLMKVSNKNKILKIYTLN